MNPPPLFRKSQLRVLRSSLTNGTTSKESNDGSRVWRISGLKSVLGWPAISFSTWQQSRVGQIVWFGWLSAISQLASRVGEGGGVRQLCLHSVTQPYTTWPRWREQGGGLCSLPLGAPQASPPPLFKHSPLGMSHFMLMLECNVEGKAV
jgi:hypothetical protein